MGSDQPESQLYQVEGIPNEKAAALLSTRRCRWGLRNLVGSIKVEVSFNTLNRNKNFQKTLD